MIGFKLSAPGWTDFEAKITRWRDFDLVALAHRIAAIMIEENAKARLRGIGADGEPLEPIKDTTWERRRRAGKNGGPPLLPDNQSSRAVADASAEVSQLGTSVVRVALHWPTMEPWLRYHRVDVPMGDGVRPARECSTPFGIGEVGTMNGCAAPNSSATISGSYATG